MRTTALLWILLGAGCTADQPMTPPEPSELGPELTADELAHVPDGATGWARVKTVDGVELLPYVAHNGFAIYQDDIVLGPIAKVDARLRGGAVTSSGERWTDNKVDFAFNPSFTGNAQTRVLQALGELEAVIPIDFNEVPYGTHTGGWIEFKWGPSTMLGGSSTAVGMMGCGEIHCSPYEPFESKCRSDCGQWIYFGSSALPSKKTVKHEVLHALGFFHEQSRNDRDEFIDFNPQCLSGKAEQYSIRPASLDLGPYDFASIMHYESHSNCMLDPDNDEDDYLLGCACIPMTKLEDGPDADDKLDLIVPSNDLTGEDVNSAYRAYAKAIGGNGGGDQFGAAVAIADFDGDGYDDVAIAAPGNNTQGSTDAGAVFLFKGTSNRLVPWRALTQAHVPGEDLGAGDGFGSALAAGDLDNDGFADLVVGVPNEDFGTATDAGIVHVFRGSRTGLAFAKSYTQVDGNGTNQASDRFGAAIALGSLVGKMNQQIVVGAPGDLVASRIGNVKAGAVYIFYFDPGALFTPSVTRLASGGAMPGDEFGAALATGRINDDGYADLAIGAPGASNGGAVHLYLGRLPPEFDPGQWSAMATYSKSLANPGGGAADRFGAAIVMADVLVYYDYDTVVVGAPGVASGVGRVYLFGQKTYAFSVAQTLYSNGAQEAGDEFGAAVAYRSMFGGHQLVVGSPGENDDSGIVTTYEGGYKTVDTPVNYYQSIVPLEMSEMGDRFGQAIATGNLYRLGDTGSTDDQPFGSDELVVGAPGERIGLLANQGTQAGVIDVVLSDTSIGQWFHQESATRD